MRLQKILILIFKSASLVLGAGFYLFIFYRYQCNILDALFLAMCILKYKFKTLPKQNAYIICFFKGEDLCKTIVFSPPSQQHCL